MLYKYRMISFSKYLTEVFDTTVPAEMKKQYREGLYQYDFRINGDRFRVSIVMHRWASGVIWSVSFSTVDYTDYSDFESTGRNRDQFKILAGVVNIIKQHIGTHGLNPFDQIQFSGTLGSKARLYQAIAEKICKTYGMKLTIETSDRVDFFLVKQ